MFTRDPAVVYRDPAARRAPGRWMAKMCTVPLSEEAARNSPLSPLRAAARKFVATHQGSSYLSAQSLAELRLSKHRCSDSGPYNPPQNKKYVWRRRHKQTLKWFHRDILPKPTQTPTRLGRVVGSNSALPSDRLKSQVPGSEF